MSIQEHTNVYTHIAWHDLLDQRVCIAHIVNIYGVPSISQLVFTELYQPNDGK